MIDEYFEEMETPENITKQIEEANYELLSAYCNADFKRMAELKYGKIPWLEKKIKGAKMIEESLIGCHFFYDIENTLHITIYYPRNKETCWESAPKIASRVKGSISVVNRSFYDIIALMHRLKDDLLVVLTSEI